MNIDFLVTDTFADFFRESCTPEQVRTIERGQSSAPLWAALAELGFPDLTVAEDKGGAAASPETAGQVFFHCGAAALPVPLAFTIWIRGILSQNGETIPEGPITLSRHIREKGAIRCRQVPFAATAEWVLAYGDGQTLLLPVKAATITSDQAGNSNTLHRDLEWSGDTEALVLASPHDWHHAGAAITTAMLAGAASRCLDLVVDYANTRQQFGRPIGKFQAIQQQLSVLAEEVFAARMAAQLAFACHDGSDAALVRIAMAKGRASEAVNRIASISHGVVAAIGITDEFDLHLHTRRLYEWRRDFGSETAWFERTGSAFFAGCTAGTQGGILDFLLEHAPAA